MPRRDQFKSNEEYNAYFREYRNRNIEKVREYNRVYTAKWRKEFGYNAVNRWKINNPNKVKAEEITHYAIKRGLIEKRDCEICGRKAQAHHEDYNKPLEVKWLCSIHHKEAHRKQPIDI